MLISDNAGFERVYTLIQNAIGNRTLSKMIMSRPRDKTMLRAVAMLFEKNGELSVSLESFMKDGKAVRKNHTVKGNELQKTSQLLTELAITQYRQINLICAGISVEILVSDKGKLHITEKKQEIKEIAVAGHDRIKKYLLSEGEAHPFLIKLGVCSENGRVYDKKQAKFRQINKFLDQIDAIYGDLPQEGELCVCDLCCGKSYLSFAAYWYFSVHKARKVSLYGVDLKSDVIAYCSEVARSLGWDGMHFKTGDVSRFQPPSHPNLVLSLHACDVATDYVLAGAIRSEADVILSTPCCHHEINGQLKGFSGLDFICKHSMLRQKLADAVTDGLRAKTLEIFGYDVTVCELIDPDETPKNLLIRAVKRRKKPSSAQVINLIKEYSDAIGFFGITPKLWSLLEDEARLSAISGERKPQ
ncbi:MAG: SAM-dependent methyltransferase [Clostridia bacterium]|nr:SAM-dependent methyltransferase [Clostridia bacterium]